MNMNVNLAKVQTFREVDCDSIAPSPITDNDINCQLELEELDQNIDNALSALNFRRQRFVEAYSNSGNASESAKAAGFSANTARSIGQRLLTNVDIILAVKLLSFRQQLKTGIDSAWKRMAAVETYTKAMKQTPPDMVSAIRAITLICRMDGDFTVQKVQPETDWASMVEKMHQRLRKWQSKEVDSPKSFELIPENNDF